MVERSKVDLIKKNQPLIPASLYACSCGAKTSDLVMMHKHTAEGLLRKEIHRVTVFGRVLTRRFTYRLTR